MAKEKWGELLSEYRAMPGAHSKVCRRVGCAVQTGMKYWLRGGRMPFAKIPIRDIISAEQDAIRAARQRSRETAHVEEAHAMGRLDILLARQDEIAERVADLKLIGMLKMNVIDTIAMVSSLLGAADLLRVEIVDALTSEEMREKIRKNPRVGIGIMQSLGALSLGTVQAADMVIKLERLILGEVTERRSITFESAEDAQLVIRRAHEAVQRQQLSLVE